MSFNDEYLKLRKKRLEAEEFRNDPNQNPQVYLDTFFPIASSDIAPVRQTTTEKTDEREWFEKGAFDDGYQFGDVFKTIYGSVVDLKTNIGAGILGMGEKIVDAGAYVVGGVGGMFSEDFKDDVGDFIADDLYDEGKIARTLLSSPAKLFGVDSETDSVFGEKTDSLAQSGGQLLGTTGLQAVGVPWFVTSGVTSFGGEAENALQQGATYGQAGLSAAITAGAEILTEKISGGISFGGKTLDDGLTNLIASNISNKTAQTLLKFGLDATGEGFEEVFSNAISAVGQKITYDKNKDISFGEIFLSEEAFENFIGGAVLGGGSNVIGGLKAKAKGKDALTGLAKDTEQKVVDKVFKDAAAEAEKDGKKLSAKEKADLYNRVLNDLEKGRIDIDIIEEVLGEDTYKSYKDTIDYENDILKQFEELGNKTNPTLADQSLYAELKSKIAEINQTSQRDALKSRLSEEVFGKVKDSKLAESYNERARRGQHFEADLSGYDVKQQEVIKRAVASGVLNNTNRTHEFVDLIAKISADKGVLFDFTNNAKLKESGFAIDGKEINGFVTKDGITVNIDSHKALQSTVGHEITHVLEGTELYAEMQRALFDYVKSKGDFDGRRTSLAELYKNIEGADVDAELTADLVGDYLFTDEDFVKHLSTKNRNVFQKMYDEIKHLWKLATAGSKEARELEKVKRAFDKAYKEVGQVQGDTKYSSTDKKTIDKYSQKQYNDFGWAREADAVTENELDDMYSKIHEKGSLKKFAQTKYGESVIEVNDSPHIIAANNTFVFVKGSKNSPEITRVVRVNFYDEASIDVFRKDIYENTDNRSLEAYARVMGEEIVQYYDRSNSASYREYSEQSESRSSRSESKGNQRVAGRWTFGDATDAETQSNEIAPIKASSKDGVFFDEKNTKYSLSADGDIGPVRDDVKQKKEERINKAYSRIDNKLQQDKIALEADLATTRTNLEQQLADKSAYISNRASELYNELSNLKKGVRASKALGYLLDHGYDWNTLKSTLLKVKRWAGETVNPNSAEESVIRELLNEEYEDKLYELENLDNQYQEKVSKLEAQAEIEKEEALKAEQRIVRAKLHKQIIDGFKSEFEMNGYILDDVLKNAKNLRTFSTVDNTPQRVMEKALGYKEGGLLADLTVNKVAQNETAAIKWLNSYTDRKNGLLSQLSKQYNIKPGSKESAAAMMYAEGFYADENGDLIKYGDEELAKDFPDATTQRNIKGLANDKRIRQIYDETLAAINESRARNAYPEIPRLDNYFLHFRAMEDTFSRLGLPFNPNDIKAKDLPTDLNGVTADLKPGQPFFASQMHRSGNKTSHDLLGGLERYLSSAKNQIYHIDDIQTLRALRNYIADTYGQANGLEGLDALTEEEAQERIEKVYGSHLSTFAKFLNEEANVIAGKTALIDRGLEGVIGRRGITFLDTVNKQVGSNMVGFNVSSSLTNVIPVMQAFAKTNKLAFVKGFAQTVSNRLGSISGNSDGFAESSPVMIRRKGADRFYRTPFQKVGDAGYTLMGAVDSISTEIIARAKYNELTQKGMDAEQAHIETDKWVSRLMGDRSLGQTPQLYNSKMLGLVTKFQLEVRNQLDSQFYDTIQEAKVSTEDIENQQARNAKTAAKVASTFFQLAVAQHVFGKAFEAVAGYNPAFDIISVLATLFGFDDDEESEDTALDNIEQGFLELLEDLPYTSVLTGGRIPISSALPIEQFVTGKDDYGNEKSRLETLGEAAPYYLLPTGYGQIKKTAQGLSMFSDEHPVAGSYTDSGNLRFPVDDTLGNRVQAGLFGQWANKNARAYFDNDIAPLNEKQTQEYIDVEMPIQDYWDYRKRLKGLSTLEEKAEYINDLDLSDEQKNILINNIANRKDDLDMSDYDDYENFDEFDYASKYPNKYAFLKDNGISYATYNASKESREAYNWAYNNPEKYTLSKAVSSDLVEYRRYTADLYDIKADKDENGKSISGSRKDKVADYINGLDISYEEKIILFKSEYNADDTYNYEIIDYLNNREDISYDDMVAILRELGFTVKGDTITWD